jgi:hypothetical protein
MRPLQPSPAGKIPLTAASPHFSASSSVAARHAAVAATSVPSISLTSQLQHECEAMARHALQHGLNIPPDLVARLAALLAHENAPETDSDASGRRIRELAVIHLKLTHAVAPATPQGIALLDVHRASTRHSTFLGPVPLIRMLTLTALGFLVAVIASAMSAEVTGENIERGLLASSGSTLLLNLLFLMCCAGLGASFATLFHAHRYIANSTYDPKFDASYCARLILGLIAGLILVEMLPAHLFANGAAGGFGKPAMAMLGGFSASAVHRLLQRLVDALETVVSGDPTVKLQAAMANQRAQAASERVQVQGEYVQRLVSLQRMLDGSVPLEAVRQQLAELTQTVISGEATAASTGTNEGRAPAAPAPGAPTSLSPMTPT